MMAVGLDHNLALGKIKESSFNERIRIACINSPGNVTISGDIGAIDELISDFQNKGIFARKLKTDGRAYHSHHMELLGQEYQDLISTAQAVRNSHHSLSSSSSRIKMFSSVTGQLIECDLAITPKYWRTNLESPVLFNDAIQNMMSGHKYHLIEVGPHSALELPINEIRTKLQLTERGMMYSSTLARGKNSVHSVLGLIGKLYSQGHKIAFDKVNNVSPEISGRVIRNMPNYRWQYDSPLWHESRISSEFRKRRYPRHDLLGSRIPGGSGETVSWRNILRIKDVY